MSGNISLEVHDLNWRGRFVIGIGEDSDDILIDKQSSAQDVIVKQAMENLFDDRYSVGSVVD